MQIFWNHISGEKERKKRKAGINSMPPFFLKQKSPTPNLVLIISIGIVKRETTEAENID